MRRGLPPSSAADRAELQRTLQELHADIFSQINQEVGLYGYILSTGTSAASRCTSTKFPADAGSQTFE